MLKTYDSDTFDIERSPLPREVLKDVYYTFFSKSNVDFISEQITQRLEGVHPEKKHIIVPIPTILSVMDSIYTNTYRDVDKMTMMTISYLSDYIRNEYDIERQNSQLSNWVIQYTPDTGLQQHPQIKLRLKRPTPMIFNMTY
jgi:hypothetical protein